MIDDRDKTKYTEILITRWEELERKEKALAIKDKAKQASFNHIAKQDNLLIEYEKALETSIKHIDCDHNCPLENCAGSENCEDALKSYFLEHAKREIKNAR